MKYLFQSQAHNPTSTAAGALPYTLPRPVQPNLTRPVHYPTSTAAGALPYKYTGAGAASLDTAGASVLTTSRRPAAPASGRPALRASTPSMAPSPSSFPPRRQRPLWIPEGVDRLDLRD